MSTVRQVLEDAGRRFDSESPRLDAEILLAHALGKTRAWLYAHADDQLDHEFEMRVEELVSRRARGEPVAYLLQRREFWSLDLRVSPATLIPRPETELLVEAALELPLPARGVRVLDLGTGSGAIALALASERPGWVVEGLDSSPEAVALACDNGRQLGLDRVRFRIGNWLDGCAGCGYHLIVSNPPYVAEDAACLEVGDLRFEPRGALVAPEQGLRDLRRIVAAAPACMAMGAWLALEHGPEQGAAVRRLLSRRGFHGARTLQDNAGMDRVAVGHWTDGGRRDE